MKKKKNEFQNKSKKNAQNTFLQMKAYWFSLVFYKSFPVNEIDMHGSTSDDKVCLAIGNADE